MGGIRIHRLAKSLNVVKIRLTDLKGMIKESYNLKKKNI